MASYWTEKAFFSIAPVLLFIAAVRRARFQIGWSKWLELAGTGILLASVITDWLLWNPVFGILRHADLTLAGIGVWNNVNQWSMFTGLLCFACGYLASTRRGSRPPEPAS